MELLRWESLIVLLVGGALAMAGRAIVRFVSGRVSPYATEGDVVRIAEAAAARTLERHAADCIGREEARRIAEGIVADKLESYARVQREETRRMHGENRALLNDIRKRLEAADEKREELLAAVSKIQGRQEAEDRAARKDGC